MTQPQPGIDRYRRVARGYELMARLYSLGAIARTKRWLWRQIQPRGEILVAGAGSGEDLALLVAQARDHVRVTVVDASPAMLARARRRAPNSPEVEFVEGDVFAFPPDRKFDRISAFFFLNVFGSGEVAYRFADLSSRLKPQGQLLVADFDPVPLARATGGLQQIYYAIPSWVFAGLTQNPRHRIYDYAHFESPGCRLVQTRRFRVIAGAPPAYRGWIFRKVTDPAGQ